MRNPRLELNVAPVGDDNLFSNREPKARALGFRCLEKPKHINIGRKARAGIRNGDTNFLRYRHWRRKDGDAAGAVVDGLDRIPDQVLNHP